MDARSHFQMRAKKCKTSVVANSIYEGAAVSLRPNIDEAAGPRDCFLEKMFL
jgi:hypothetical protein